MKNDRKTNQGGSKQGESKQAPGRRETNEGTGGRQGNKGSEQGGQKGGKQNNR
jgi:hypothetical protein